MVSRYYFKCPSCGKIYQLKIQLDKNIYIYDWPIVVECMECGDVIQFFINKNGVQQINKSSLSEEQIKSADKTTVIGYSSSLPIAGCLYMKDMSEIESTMFFSPFMIVQMGHFSQEELAQYNDYLDVVQKNFLPYRSSVKCLLPILNKGNIDAYSKKWEVLFGRKDYQPIGSHKIMHDSFWQLIERSYINLTFGSYTSNVGDVYYKRLSDYIKSSLKDEIISLKNKLDESGLISKWYKNEALPYIADYLSSVQKFFPSFIYSFLGVTDVSSRGDLKIVTVSCDDAVTSYSNGYEIFVHGLKIIVGVINLIENENVDSFVNPGMAGIMSIKQFSKLTGGLMEDKLSDYKTVYDYVCTTMNRKVRNAADHNRVGYDSETQIVVFHYDPNDDSKFLEMPLIELCHIAFCQFLHITEMAMLARKIVEKSQS